MADHRSEYRWGNPDICQVTLSVDPGLNSCGWALWDHELWPPVPMETGLITPKRSDSLGVRMAHVQGKLYRRYPVTHLVVEMPHYQESMVGSFGWKTGDLQKLVLLVGFLVADNWGAVTLVNPREWKGQLPKAVVEERIRKRLGTKACAGFKKDIWDAVGIGLWALTGRV
jgi:Holliday junction resolvasome RuvABC endonuclease subunit